MNRFSKCKKKIALLLVMVLVSGSLAACSGGDQQTPAEDSTPAVSSSAAGDTSAAQSGGELSGSITVTAWNTSATAIEAGAKRFMEMHPGTDISLSTIPDNNKLFTQLATGADIPDLMQFQNRDTQTMLVKYPGSFEDLTDIVGPEEGNLVPAVVPLLQQDGKYWAIPWDVAPCAMFYRIDIFEEYGVDANAIDTWDDYIEAGKTINEKSGGTVKTFGFDYNGASSADMVLVPFYQLGGDMFASEGVVNYDSPEMVRAFELVKRMVDADITVNLPNEWTDRITALANNSLCTVPYGIWFSGTLKENVADQAGKWGLIPLPAFEAGGNHQANSGGSVLMVSSRSENKELAKAFATWFLMSDEGNAINMEVSNLFNSYVPSYEDPSYKQVDDYFGLSTAEWAANHSSEIPPLPFPAYFTDVFDMFRNACGPYFLENKDVHETLQETTAAAQAQYDLLVG